jgi:hypothetical protein
MYKNFKKEFSVNILDSVLSHGQYWVELFGVRPSLPANYLSKVPVSFIFSKKRFC